MSLRRENASNLILLRTTVKKLKNSKILSSVFRTLKIIFFYAVVYGLMFNKLQQKSEVKLERAREVLGDALFFDLKQIESNTMLDHSLFGHFKWCRFVNTVLGKHKYFLRFFERRNKFRYQVRQKLKTKNEMRRELSTCAIRKLNGYDLLRNSFRQKETVDLTPIDIVYEPTIDVKKPIFY